MVKKKRKKRTTVKGRIKQRRRYKLKDVLSLMLVALRVGGVVLGGVAVILAFTSLGMWFVDLPALQLETIDVQGTEYVDPQTIIAASKLKGRKNILLVSLSGTARRIEELAWVRRVTIKRELPDRITIVVYERRPYAVINLGELYYLDEQGVIFAPWEAGMISDLPIITGIKKDELARKKKENLEAVSAALDLLRTIDACQIPGRQRISEINIKPLMDLSIVTAKKGVRIRMGHGEYRDKLEKLAKLMRTIGTDLDGVKSIDLKYPDRAIVKFEQQDLVKKFSSEGYGS